MNSNDSSKMSLGGVRRKNEVRVAVSALFVVPLLILWVILATDDDSNIALVRNEIIQDASDRTWHGTMANTTDSQYRDIAVAVRFLDNNDQPVGEINGTAKVLEPGQSFDLHSPLPLEATAMQIYSLEWETGRNNNRTDPPLGPWATWPFGHVQADWP